MKVILQKDVPNLGDAGDIRDVADGYARNFLLPRKLVIMANDSSTKAMEHQKKLIRFKKAKRKKTSEELSTQMSGLTITVTKQGSEEGKLFGSVTSMDLAKELAAKGYAVDKRKIQLENPIKQAGEYEVVVKLDEGVQSTVKVVVEKE